MPPISETDATAHHAEALPAPHPQLALPAPHENGQQQPAPSGSGKWLRLIGLVVVLALVAALVIWKMRQNKQSNAEEMQKTEAAARRPTPVTVMPVQSRTMPIFYTALGTVTPYNSVTIKSRVDGQLISVNVREGQQVRQGQLLAQIDPRPYAALVAQAEGQLIKDEAAARNNEAEANRYRALYQAGVVSKESEDAQISNSGQSVGTLAADRANIQTAKVNLAYTRITSPINGVVGLRQVDPGNIVHATDTTGLLLVTQLQPIAVIFTLPEEQLPQVLQLIRAGKKITVEAYDRSESKHLASGTLLTIDNAIDTTTGTVKGKAVFNNTDGALFPNQFVNARVILEMRQNSLIVPAAALQTGANGNFVYVVKPCPASGCPEPASAGGGSETRAHSGKAKRGSEATQPGTGPGNSAEGDGAQSGHSSGPKYYVTVQNVAVDLTEGSLVILKSGVNAGDQVVTDGQEKLTNNAPVIPKAARAGSASANAANSGIGSVGTTSAAPPVDSPSPGARNSPAGDSTPTGQPTGQPSGQGTGRP